MLWKIQYFVYFMYIFLKIYYMHSVRLLRTSNFVCVTCLILFANLYRVVHLRPFKCLFELSWYKKYFLLIVNGIEKLIIDKNFFFNHFFHRLFKISDVFSPFNYFFFFIASCKKVQICKENDLDYLKKWRWPWNFRNFFT